MNRQILFKAKRKDNGEWVEGYLFEFQPCQYMICDKKEYERPSTLPVLYFFRYCSYEINPDTLCQYTGLNDNTKWEDLTESEKELFLSNWNYQEDRKNKVEDWNGRKIWENDILICHANEYDLERVVFGEFNVIDTETLEVVDRVIGWHTNVIETDALSKCEPFCLPMPLTDYYIKKGEVEVLGNIFDNADLLEVE